MYGFSIGNPFDTLWGWVSSPFESLAGWAGDKIFDGITNWIAKGCVQLLGFVWAVMDRTSTPRLDAEWFSGTSSSPYQLALRIGGLVLLAVFMIAVGHGIGTGDVGGVIRRVAADLPLTVFVMVSLVTLTQAAIGLTDAMSDAVWAQLRGQAIAVFDGLGLIATATPAGTFLAPLVLLVLMIALLVLWFVLLLRDSLIYLVVVLAVAFAIPAMVWPAVRGMARHSVELLAALAIAKPVIALALSVGVGALGGIGATGTPGDGVVDNGLAEFGTLVVGIITFGVAAFMPYLVYRLLPVVAAATIAAGVATAPLRAAAAASQAAFYGSSVMRRLSSEPAPFAPPGASTSGDTSGPDQSGSDRPATTTTITAPRLAAAAIPSPIARSDTPRDSTLLATRSASSADRQASPRPRATGDEDQDGGR